MISAYLGLGSNIDAELNTRSAIAELRAGFDSIDLSPVYRSPALGFEGDDFINLVARINTMMSPLDLKNWLFGLENRHGRRRDAPRFSSRTLDIDILLYGELWLHSPELEIPRDEILTAAHILKPLAELAPDLIHPVKRRTIQTIWEEFPDDNSWLTPITL